MRKRSDPQLGTKVGRGQRALAQYLVDRSLSMSDVANALDVSPPTVFAWVWGHKSPRPEMRAAIAAWTNGAIPASLWETTEERKRREKMTGKRAA